LSTQRRSSTLTPNGVGLGKINVERAREWRNGRRGGLKIRFSKESGGSNPPSRTITFYTRAKSPYLYARIVKEDGTLLRISTGATTEAEAQFFVLTFLSKQPAQLKPKVVFDQFCAAYRHRLLPTQFKKPIHKMYLQQVENWIVPFFGQHERINNRNVEEFYEWIAQQMSGVPSKSLLNSINVVLRKLFRDAKEAGFETPAHPLSLRGVGRNQERRDAIAIDHYRKLYRCSRHWHKRSKNWLSAYKRQLLHEYILICANTGIRPGEEVRSLRWTDVEYREKFVKLRVWKGKRGFRPVIGRKVCERYLERLRKLTGHHEHLFCMPDGQPIQGESEMFANLCVEAGIPKYQLYSLRHLYISTNVIKGVPYHIIAKNCGTSVEMLSRYYDHSEVEAFAEVEGWL
jgi:integrase